MERNDSDRLRQLEQRVVSLQRRVDRTRRRPWATLALATAMGLALPMWAWTYDKPHADFEPGTPISSTEVNETVDDVYTALNTVDDELARLSASRPIDDIGPLPAAGTLTSLGGTVILFVSGSGYRSGAGGTIGMDVRVDGATVGTVRSFTNEVGSHKAFVAQPVILEALPAGDHALDLIAATGTSSDGNDYFVVVALQLPR